MGECWIAGVTPEICCSGKFGVGNPVCWDGFFTYERCCGHIQHLSDEGAVPNTKEPANRLDFDPNLAPIEVDDRKTDSDSLQAKTNATDVSENGCWIGDVTPDLCCSIGSAGQGNPMCWDKEFTWDRCCSEETLNGKATVPMWQTNLYRCLHEYDDPNYRRWFIAQSGVPFHSSGAQYGSPSACSDGGHQYWYAIVMVPSQTRLPSGDVNMDIGVEFGVCMPSICTQSIVQTVLIPFYFGPHVGAPWGPQTKNPGMGAKFPPMTGIDNAMEFAMTVGQDSFTDAFPFKSRVWPYQPTWNLSDEDSIVVLAVVAVPLSATVVALFSPRVWKRANPLHFVFPLAVHEQLRRLSRGGDESAMLHVMRVVLQMLVVWQHCVFFLDWVSGEGKEGIAPFAPLTQCLAWILGRVNTSFVCLSAHLAYRSITLTLASTSKGPARVVIAWIVQRWCAQVGEFGVWTFYFLRIAPRIPYRPFLDFVSIWYNDRVSWCDGDEKTRLPLRPWVLSSLLVYWPINAIFGVHPHSSSTKCHNLAVFETIFWLGAVAAGLACLHYCAGFRTLVGTVVALLAAAVSSTKLGGPEQFSDAREVDWRLEYFNPTVPRLLPAALLTCSLVAASSGTPLADLTRHLVNRRRRYCWLVVVVLLGTTFAFDFLTWSQTSVIANWRVSVFSPLQAVARFWEKVLRNEIVQHWLPPPVLAVWVEIPHVAGIFLFVKLCVGLDDGDRRDPTFRNRHPVAHDICDKCPKWVLVASRLSLGVNLCNIFILHYVVGRFHDYPIEYSHVHLAMYTVCAWAASVFIAFVVHCLASPLSAVLRYSCQSIMAVL